MKSLPALALITLCISPGHGVVIIDDFREGTFDVSATGTLPTNDAIDIKTGLTITSTIGGQRVARAHNTDPASSTNVRITTIPVPGRFDWDVDSGAEGHFHLRYGYNEYGRKGNQTNWAPGLVGNEPAVYNSLNTDLSGETKIIVPLVGADIAGTIRVGLISNNGESATPAVYSFSVPVAGGLAVGDPVVNLEFPFTSFTKITGDDIDFTDIDQIIIEANTVVTSADWSLGTVTAVPEPSSPMLLGMVSLLAIQRRRR